MILSKKALIQDTVFSQEVDGEMVLLDMNSEHYFGLDTVGCDIWRAIQERNSLQAVYETMLNNYDVEAEPLKKDLEVFIGQLKDAGLIELQE